MTDPHQDIPRGPGGLPDDRFDGTDSGGEGWDTPYPPRTGEPTSLDLPASDEETVPFEAPREGEYGQGEHQPSEPIEPPSGDHQPSGPKRTVDGTSYDTDGPDEPAGTPQR